MPNLQKLQFRVLYREFLFRMVDLELLSGSALGDMSKLFGQFAALLVFISVFLALAGFAVADARMSPETQTIITWSAEHFLIATTMLVVGLFAVLSWDSTFPGRRDVLVLAPLPVHSWTMFLAKAAAVATALSVSVGALHIFAGLVWPFALNKDTAAHAAPSLDYDPPLAPVEATGLKAVLNHDLAQAFQVGALAPGTGGGVSIGVSKHGVRRVFTYGTAKTDSIFEIASISKTFTGLILAQMAAQGKTRLDEPVRALLPQDAAGPSTDSEITSTGREITLLDLATHHSGLPPMPYNMNRAGTPNPGADYHADDLYKFLAGWGLRKPLGAAFAYSNLGVGLLGVALGNRAGLTYAELLKEEATGPLGLADTGVSLAASQRGRVIQAWDGRHRPMRPWDLDALAGAGAILSTAPDMLTYLEANLHPERVSNSGTLAAALASSHELRADVESGLRIGLAWLYNTDTGVYWHNGAISGYTSYAFFDPKHDCAAIVLFNGAANAFGFADTLGEHIRARLDGEAAISLDAVIVPASGGAFGLIRLFGVYWLTMLAAGAFIFCCVLGVQGLAAQVLPRRLFLRASAFLQLAAFCLFVSVYFLEPKLTTPGAIAATHNQGYLEWSPSYWFLGLFQQLNGSPALASLARRAWLGLAIAIGATAAAYTLAYFRTLRRIAEEPDIAPSVRGRNWLPAFGNAFGTAVAQFSFRSLLRSRQHRLLFAFYLGIGFAALILFLKSPVTQQLSDVPGGVADPVSVSLLGSTILIMGLCVVGARVVFSLPLDLHANWIFRITPPRSGAECLAARRRALYALSAAPVWAGSAALLLSIWPWQIAAEHLLVLALTGAVLAELCLSGTQKIPFTCSYLPGKSNFHMTFLICTTLILNLIAGAARLERRALDDLASYAAMIAGLTALLVFAWWRSRGFARSPEGKLQFEEPANPAIFALDLHRDGVTPIQPG